MVLLHNTGFGLFGLLGCHNTSVCRLNAEISSEMALSAVGRLVNKLIHLSSIYIYTYTYRRIQKAAEAMDGATFVGNRPAIASTPTPICLQCSY